MLGISVAAAVDAWRVARRSDGARRSPLDRGFVYVALTILWVEFGTPRLKALLNRVVAEAFSIPSIAMEPTVLAGDWVMTVPKRSPIRRGDLIVYHADNGPFLKRVVAGPHDTIGMTKGTLTVNGQAVSEPYRRAETEDLVAPEFTWQRSYLLRPRDSVNYRPSLETWGPLLIPGNEYFTLGDNRGNSLDGRYLGFTEGDSIYMEPRVIYFSWNDSTHRARWNRIGIVPR